jgi:hypothetical protein
MRALRPRLGLDTEVLMEKTGTTTSPEQSTKKLTIEDVRRTRGGLRVATHVNAGVTLHYNKIKW